MTATPLISDGLKMIGILVLIVGGLIFLNHYVRRQMHAGGGRSGGRRINILENTHLGLKKSIALVQIPGAVLVLGVTADRITLLDRIDDADSAVGERSTPTAPAPEGSFKHHLRRLTSTFGGEPPFKRTDESR
jgi:flagellar protein FliO/FliZ